MLIHPPTGRRRAQLGRDLLAEDLVHDLGAPGEYAHDLVPDLAEGLYVSDLVRLAGFEPATRCLEGTANEARIVRDVHFSRTHDPLSTGVGRGGYYKRRLQGGGALGPGHPSDRRP